MGHPRPDWHLRMAKAAAFRVVSKGEETEEGPRSQKPRDERAQNGAGSRRGVRAIWGMAHRRQDLCSISVPPDHAFVVHDVVRVGD